MPEVRIRLSLAANRPVLSVDEGIAGLLGYSAADFLAARVHLAELVHRDDRDLAETVFSGPVGEAIIRLRRADGKVCCVRARHARRAGGAVLDLRLRDVRELARTAGRRSGQAGLRALLDSAEDLVAFKDRHHVYTAASRTLAALAGMAEPAGLVGLTDYDVFPEAFADIGYRLERQVREGLPAARELRDYRTAGGRVGWLDHRVNPVTDAHGRVAGLCVVARDITESMVSEQELRREHDMLDTVETVIVALDGDGRITMINRKGCDLLGYDQAELVGQDWFSTCLPAGPVRERVREVFARVLAGDLAGGEYLENNVLTRSGDERLIAWHNSILRDRDGKVLGGLAAGEDITDRRRAERRLHLAANVFTHAREGIMITDADGVILEVNDAFTTITGYRREDVVGRDPRLLGSGRQGREFYAAMWRALAVDGNWSGEIWNRRKDGEEFAAMETISALRDETGRIRQYVALFNDITPLKEHERQLEHIAHHDALTGLPNRVLLADRLRQAMAQAHRRGQKLALAYVDLDGFKAINDRYGHDVGDRLLTTLAGRMKQSLREGDTLARLGGDEFVALLIDLGGVEAAAPMLDRLLGAAAEQVMDGDFVLQVSASVGVTFYPQAEEVEADQLLRQADQAMYQAKLAGKNRYHVFDSEQDRSVRAHHEGQSQIRAALAAREFVLHYQPKVNLRTGDLVGVEALVRWQHPRRGLLPPEAFLPLIEEHPLAIELGEWAIDSALAQAEHWRASGLGIPVSVNIAARHLLKDDFVERLRAILAAHPRAGPGGLELEVAEAGTLADLTRVAKVLDACRGMGVVFALDGFGAGYSSLTYLKRLMVARIKIDRDFVHGMLDDPDDLALLEGVLGLAGAFRRQVIAEGVETVEQGTMLLSLGCEFAQGFAIARPMPAAEVPAWAASWRPDPAWTGVAPVCPDDLPLLYAEVDHRTWVAGVEAYLMGLRETPPPLDNRLCRLHSRLNDTGAPRNRTRPAMRVIETLHRKAHALALELCECQARGRGREARARLDELHGLRDALLGQLQGCIRHVGAPLPPAFRGFPTVVSVQAAKRAPPPVPAD